MGALADEGVSMVVRLANGWVVLVEHHRRRLALFLNVQVQVRIAANNIGCLLECERLCLG